MLKIKIIKTFLLLLVSGYFLGTGVSNVDAVVSTREGSLNSYLEKMRFGIEGDGLWVTPTLAQQNEVGEIVEDILEGQYSNANDKAAILDGEVLKFIDGTKEYYILHINLERMVSGNYRSLGGTYVFYPEGVNSAIQIPHPSFDINTDKEGVEAYLSLGSKYLLLSGTHRNSSDVTSSCQLEYKESDASHNNGHYFFSVHKALSMANDDTIFIELHGFGSSMRNTLWSQCDATHNMELINISEGIDDLDETSFMYLLHQEITENTTIKSCVYSPSNNVNVDDVYTSATGGTHNVIGRLINDVTNVCDVPATSSSHRFVHIEQSYEVRNNRRGDVVEALRNVHEKLVVSLTRANVDQNSTINTVDAMLTLRNSLGLDMSQTNWQSSTTTGDVNCDGISNSTDAMLILRYSLGLSMGGTGWCVG